MDEYFRIFLSLRLILVRIFMDYGSKNLMNIISGQSWLLFEKNGGKGSFINLCDVD